MIKYHDAKLRALGTKSKKHRIAVFELPPHKRTVIVSDISTKKNHFYIQLPYLIFTFFYYQNKNGFFLIEDEYEVYNGVYVFFKSTPLTRQENKLGQSFHHYYKVCFGEKYDLYVPEKTLKNLFAKIANIYFTTTNNLDMTPRQIPSYKSWASRTKKGEDLLKTVNWEANNLNITNFYNNATWKFFK